MILIPKYSNTHADTHNDPAIRIEYNRPELIRMYIERLENPVNRRKKRVILDHPLS